jgi:ubiquinone/menaquinone biosynthesis C-methylase UbiE
MSEAIKGEFRHGKLSPTRRLLKIFHPEGIPWIGTLFYNALTATSIFQRNYDAVAQDILSYGSEGSILDIGTGPGWLLVKLHQHAPRLRITGLDASAAMVAKARKNMAEAGLADEIEIKEGNANRLPFADNTFETIVSTGSIHHWKDPIVGLNEVYRVLKAGGNALLYDIVSDTPQSVLKEMARGYGRLKTMLFWLHAFEEPFYSHKAFEMLAQPSLFKKGSTRFVGILCCLILRKEGGGA